MTNQEFSKLHNLLKDFLPVISRIDCNISRVDRNISKVDRNIDEIYKGIEGEREGNTRDGTESHILITMALQKINGSLSFNGFQLSPIKATMILHARVVLNILGHGYSTERSLRVGRIRKHQRYYGCMGFVSRPV